MSEQRRREEQTPRERVAESLVGAKPPPPTTPASSGETVCIACNIPNGLWLRLFDMVDTYEATPSGTNMVKMARARAGFEPIKVEGPAIDVDQMVRGHMPEFTVAHGYALTPRVSKDVWDEWLRQNYSAPYVINHGIFAISSESRARDKVKSEMSKYPSGLEPINPDDPASKSPELKGLATLTRGSGVGKIERGERD